jgi:hypothetical protein
MRPALRARAVVLVAAAVGAGLVAVGTLLAGRVEGGTTLSPDGAFVAEVSCRRIDTLLPRAPGSGGDTPGRLLVRRTKDGRSCGQAELPMRWLARDLVWDLTAAPRTATLVGVAVWNLDACTVDTGGW